MKVSFASDLHLEFGDLEIKNESNSEVLILAGDIILASLLYDKDETHWMESIGREFKVESSQRIHRFFQQVCEEFPHVIYIFGNHEYYDSDIATAFDDVKKKLSYLDNLHILEKEKIIINDVTFLATTLWTDFNKNDFGAKFNISRRMNDFQIIKNSNKKEDDLWTPIWTPEDAYEEHQESLDFIKRELGKEENKKVVIVTHHGPSYECVPEKYQGDKIMNPGYVSDLTDLILDNPKIKNWIFGHSHIVKEFMIGSTAIMANCRGYAGRESLANNFKIKYFEVQ